MFVKNLEDCKEFTANDGCRLRELLHPKNDAVELPYSIAFAKVDINKATYRHKLEQTEIYFIISGHGMMHINEIVQQVKPGDVVLIPPGSVQWLQNNGKTEITFLAIVNPPWTDEGDTRIS